MEKDHPKSARKQAKELIHEFVEDNDFEAQRPSHANKSCCGLGLQQFDAQTHDAWLLQCPRNLDPSVLEDNRIKMPGRRFVGGLQVRCTEYGTSSPESIGYTNAKGKNRVGNIPISGVVVVSKRLNVAQPSAVEEDNSFPSSPAPPFIVKPVRHPFFGRDFKRRIKMTKAISRNLTEAKTKNIETSAFLRRNANFYKIRKQIQGTTQTLEEKEHDVRQSVLTGVKPDFMKEGNGPTYNLGDLTTGDKEERIKKKKDQDSPIQSIQKPKKRTANGGVKTKGNAEYAGSKLAQQDGTEGAPPSRKKRQKLIPNKEVKTNGVVIDLM